MTTTQVRRAEVSRTTNEVAVVARVNLDGTGASEIQTGLPFLDHMLAALAKHSSMDLHLRAEGDVEVDDHHTVEDCAIALGRALSDALGERSGIARFGYGFAPLDEALSRAVVDLSGRPWPAVDLGFRREMLGSVATESLTHFLVTLAIESRMALHVSVLAGTNDHHKAESAFKAVALSLRRAVARDGYGSPSTKGVLG